MKKRKLVVLITSFVLFFCHAQNAFSQSRKVLVDSVLFCVNRFNFIAGKDGKADSAVFLLKRVAILSPSIFPDLFGSAIDQTFIQLFNSDLDPRKYLDSPYTQSSIDAENLRFSKQRNNARVVLEKSMKDTNALMQQYLKPLNYWVESQDLLNANKPTKSLTQLFFQKYVYTNKNDVSDKVFCLKYALLLYQIEARQKNNTAFSSAILDTVNNQLGRIFNSFKETNQDLALVSKTKWLYGFSNLLKAKELFAKGMVKEAGPYYKLAASLSPNTREQGNAGSSYAYDCFMLRPNEEKVDFYFDYIAYLNDQKVKVSDNALQTVMADYALDYPEKDKLEQFYNQHNDTTKIPFATYWASIVEKKFADAPMFTITKMDGQVFDLSKMRGRWVLLDFWGTWCGPCRREHPALNQLYLKTKAQNQNLEIMTIACRDQESNVKKYIQETKYSFPIAMLGEREDLINKYPVDGYPSKFLINPDGKFMTVPFGTNLESFIQKYVQ